MEQQFSDRLMPAAEVLECLGSISRETLRGMLKRGEFPEPAIGRADGRRRYWRSSDVRAWLASRNRRRPADGEENSEAVSA